MNASSVCVTDADAFFGPRVDPCRRQFDFTLLFEQSVFTVGPSAIFIVLLSLRIPKLYREKRKTLPNSLWGFKLVSLPHPSLPYAGL